MVILNETDFDIQPLKKRGRAKKTAQFTEHVEKIERAKTLGAEIISENLSHAKTPQVVLDMAWEIVFDFFYRAKNGAVEISELNTLSGIVQKLVSSGEHLLAAEIKSPKKSGGGLDEDCLREIEKKLKLL